MPSASTGADADHMRTIRVFGLARLAVFAFASAAQAATIRFAHQDWRTFKSTGKLGQTWDPAMVSKSHGRLTERIRGDVAGGVGSTRHQLCGRYDMDFRISAGAGKF